MRILAIESSCDETAAAVVEDGRTVRSSVIYSQIETHTLYGGVVPEIASRAHIEKINQVVAQALEQAEMTLREVDAVAVTYGPGLVGPLLIGVSAAKAMAWAAGKPLIGVNHIEGHVSANFIANPDLKPPFLCLIVSGGHTNLVMVEDYGKFRILGQTLYFLFRCGQQPNLSNDGHATDLIYFIDIFSVDIEYFFLHFLSFLYFSLHFLSSFSGLLCSFLVFSLLLCSDFFHEIRYFLQKDRPDLFV